MTSVLSYNPMSDPFAAHPSASAHADPRYPHTSTPPFHGGLFPPPQSGTSSPSSTSSTRPSQGHHQHQHQQPTSSRRQTPPSALPSADEFGQYRQSLPLPLPPSSSAALAARPQARAAHSSTMPLPLPIPAPLPVDPSTAASTSTTSDQNPRARNRMSHNPSATLGNASPPRAEHLTDEYVLHPSVFAFRQAHPRRPMVGFGPYVLLQTLGEGEFGKVKLGVHCEFGVEVAIKLIRRGSLDDEVRASKVEREIDVLKTLKHPNIVRMFDVIDTDKYIGIVLEFAGGGELFDHILANRYLKEKDAQKLFAQLISGVDYLHRKHIVHRDLKLENLLLDKHRNIIITDFGFANRFDHAADDLMATSCGSPCYAAPELVVSEGLYVGSAVDIWSCGVILYAMLSGYLPYDDDPANPDGDNINLLYKYIMNTKLNFPSHMSEEAKDLLKIMLVPNPDNRCRVEEIQAHPWLEAHRDLFSRTVEQHEYNFQENMWRKSQAAKRELAMRRQVQQEAKLQKSMQRSQSTMPGATVTASALEGRRNQQRHHSALPGATTMPEHLNNAGHRTPPLQPRNISPIPPSAPLPATVQTSPIVADSPIVVSPASFPVPPATIARTTPPKMAPSTPPRQRSHSMTPAITPPKPDSAAISTTAVEDEAMDVEPALALPGPSTQPLAPPADDESSPRKPPMSANKNRHTIQVEYDQSASYEHMSEERDSRRSAKATDVPGEAEMLAVPNVDVEMDSGSSDGGHTRETTGSIDTPEASQVLITPLSPSFPPPAVLEDAAVREEERPVTPTPEAKPRALEPTTPRASAVIPREDATTPRAMGKVSEAPATTPRAGGQRFDSLPAIAPPATISGALPSGLPRPPPAKRDRSRKGMSLDKFGLAKLLGQAHAGSSVSLSRPPPSAGGAAVALQQQKDREAERVKRNSMVRPKTADPEASKDKDKKTRRRTLQLTVNRSSSPREGPATATPTPTTLGPASHPPQSISSRHGTGSPQMVIDEEGITPVPAAAHERGQSSPSIVTVDAISQQQASNSPRRGGHQRTASSSAAKKVMDWFRRKSLAKDTLGQTKQGQGVRSDSQSSFVRVEGNRPTVVTIGDRELAMESVSSIAQTQEGPSVVIVGPEEPAEKGKEVEKERDDSREIGIGAARDSANLKDAATGPAEGVRMPLASAASKTNIAPSAPAIGPAPAKHQSLPLPSQPARARSHAPEATLVKPGPATKTTTTLLRRPSTKDGSSASRFGGADDKMRVHTGLVDQSALSSKPPQEVMKEVQRVLNGMGLEIKKENDYRLRCTRVRRRKAGPTTSLTGFGSVMSVGSVSGLGGLMGNASTSRTNSQGLPIPQSPSTGLLSGGGLRGMLLRRGSSYASQLPRSDSEILVSPSASNIGLASPLEGAVQKETIYGEHSVDSGDEVKFVIELCRIKNLPGLYLLNIKRLRGSVWSFKFIYQTVLERCETLTH